MSTPLVTQDASPRLEPLLEQPTGSLLIPGAPTQPSAGIQFSLVIPTFNESKNVAALVQELTEVLDRRARGYYEIIIVDDDSPDRTWQVAQELTARYPQLRVMRRQNERGLSTAVIRGWQAARGDILGVMDGDLQHPPEVNLKLLAEMDRGADLAAASRHVEGGGVSDWSIARRMLSRGAQLLGLLLLPGVLGRLSDPMSGYFMVRRSALAGVTLDPIGYKILVEVVARSRAAWIGEAGYVFRERVEGASKVTATQYVHYLRHLLRLRWATLPQSRFLRFCVVGATGVLVDMAILYLLSDPKSLGWGLTRSKFVAAECALLSNFLLNDAWTFGDLSKRQGGVVAKARRFLGFNAICTAGIVLNMIFLNVLFNYAHVNRYLANAIAILAVTGWNYWLNRKLNWVQQRTA